MYEYIKGRLSEVTPTHAVVDCGGVGYLLQISLNTYGAIKDLQEVKLFAHQAIREDAHVLFGFFEDAERETFRLLISVSGVGAATARVILSSLSAAELEKAISGADLITLKRVKGIGAKTAERIIVDLRDKMGKIAAVLPSVSAGFASSAEASMALVALGFPRVAADKAVSRAAQELGQAGKVEDVIKLALKYL